MGLITAAQEGRKKYFRADLDVSVLGNEIMPKAKVENWRKKRLGGMERVLTLPLNTLSEDAFVISKRSCQADIWIYRSKFAEKSGLKISHPSRSCEVG